MISGFLTAAELNEILSAPAERICLISSISDIPPPTVNGIKTSRATRSTSSTIVFLFSLVAVISRNTSSSAPSSEYFFAKLTGLPAYLKFSKFIPLTV